MLYRIHSRELKVKDTNWLLTHFLIVRVNLYILLLYSNISELFQMSYEMEDTELERQYSPSMWSKRFTSKKEVVENHIKHATTGKYNSFERLSFNMI